MKALRLVSFLAFGLLAAPATSFSQIRDNEASQSVLAVQCAVSSGFSARDYEDYCRRLAKTLALLSSEQQTRVFGYLPMPGAASMGAEDSGGNLNTGNQGNAEESAKSPLNQVGSNSDAAPPSPETNSLVDMVGKFNSLFDGTASASTNPISVGVEVAASSGGTTEGTNVAGTGTATTPLTGNLTTSAGTTTEAVGGVSTGATGSTGTSGTSGSVSAPKSSGWSSLVAWFQAAEAAYNAGTLSSFLKGGK
ncbi:MAG: hypothetical protein JNJ70_14915 [Verrucomicrobiales bacterium]|nr:hypothetical protein [Verrucomicrobiales bacterium]